MFYGWRKQVPVIYLNDHFKGEHASEDIIEVSEDLRIFFFLQTEENTNSSFHSEHITQSKPAENQCVLWDLGHADSSTALNEYIKL